MSASPAPLPASAAIAIAIWAAVVVASGGITSKTTRFWMLWSFVGSVLGSAWNRPVGSGASRRLVTWDAPAVDVGRGWLRRWLG